MLSCLASACQLESDICVVNEGNAAGALKLGGQGGVEQGRDMEVKKMPEEVEEKEKGTFSGRNIEREDRNNWNLMEGWTWCWDDSSNKVKL